ncbi:hypothetical protein GF351_04585 [Candidatus Woesearchaeota archaeon]|nr:hypothetical protein [Candidatus Woesearchaeota archaeon]
MAQEQAHFYVGVKDEIEVRKNLLEASKGVLNTLQSFEEFKATRQEKLQEILKLRQILKEIHSLSNRFRKEVPTVKRSITPRQPARKTAIAEKTPAKVQEEDVEEMNKLESELTAIENKLKGLIE